jgi:hypothetical protein
MAQEVGVRNIGELRQFGSDLGKLAEQLAAAFHAAEGKMYHVCDGWNDSINAKFMNQFGMSVKEIDKIAENMQAFSRFISKSCEILEMYQSNKL